MSEEFSPEQTSALEKIEKLLRLAARNTSAEEAAAATAKAQELLVAYNLSVDSVGKAGSTADTKRTQEQLKGGMFKYQRTLWYKIAELNFCMHYTIEHFFPRIIRRRNEWTGQMEDVEVNGKEFRHTLIGKKINVRATVNMAGYLEGAIERLALERFPSNSQRFCREAIEFRTGIAHAIYWRLEEKRKKLVADEEKRRMDELARNGVSTAQALTIGSLSEQERDANEDFIYGEGYSARRRAKEAERDRLQQEAEEAYTRWAAENPEEARKEEAKRAKKREKVHRRRGSARTDRLSSSPYYWQGHDAGAKVGLDPQTEAAAKPRALA